LQVFENAWSKDIFGLIGDDALTPAILGFKQRRGPTQQPRFREFKPHGETTPFSLAHPLSASPVRNPVKPEVTKASCVESKSIKRIEGNGSTQSRVVAPLRNRRESAHWGQSFKPACFPRRALVNMAYAARIGVHFKLSPLRKLTIGVGSFILFVTATTFPSLAADDCEAIADAHAYNYCLAAKGPVYKPRPSSSHAPPQDQDASWDEGARPAEPGDAPSATHRAAPPRYPKYLNAAPARPSGAPHQNASVFSLKGR